MFLLVVAADDGADAADARAPGGPAGARVERGVVALTKIDLVDEETRRLAAAEAAALAPGLPLVEVSARTGEGLEELRAALADASADAARTAPIETGAGGDEPVLHVDRVFTVAGHGTVVTGTLWSGRLERGQPVALLPARAGGAGALDRGPRPAARASPSRASASRLTSPGVDRDEVRRGDVVVAGAAGVEPTYRLDVGMVFGAADDPRRAAGPGPPRHPRLRRPRRRPRRSRVPAAAGAAAAGRAPATASSCAASRRRTRSAAASSSDPAPPPPRSRLGTAARGGGTRRPPPAPPPAEPGPLARRVLAALEADGPRPRGAAQLAGDLGAERRAVEAAFGELAAAGQVVRAKPDVAYRRRPPTRGSPRLALALAERDGGDHHRRASATCSASAASTPRRCSSSSTPNSACAATATATSLAEQPYVLAR